MALIKQVFEKKKKCSVLNCYHYSKLKSPTAFFPLPFDVKKIKSYFLWIMAIDPKIDNLQDAIICEHHFQNHMLVVKTPYRYLKNDSYPTKLIPKPDIFPLPSNIDRIWEKASIEKRIKYAATTIAQYKNNSSFLLKSLMLYILAPESYKLLQKLLSLPSIVECKLAAKYLDTRLTSVYYELLELKFNFQLCYMSFEVIEITSEMSYNYSTDTVFGVKHFGPNGFDKEPVTTALVRYIHGLQNEWTLLLDVSFYNNNNYQDYKYIRKWMEDAIQQLMIVKFKVVAFVCPVTLTLVDYDDVTQRLQMPITNHVIDYIYDIPSLYKMLYFHSLKYNFYTESGIFIDGNCIIKYFEEDGKRKLPLTPYITNYDHCSVKNYKQLSDKFIRHLFCENTFKCMETYITLNKLDSGYLRTVMSINEMSKLLNILDPNKPENVTPEEICNIKSMIATLCKVTVVERETGLSVDNNEVKLCITYLLITLQSFLHILTQFENIPSSIIRKNLFKQNTTNYLKKYFKKSKPNAETVAELFKDKMLQAFIKPVGSNKKENLELPIAFNNIVELATIYARVFKDFIKPPDLIENYEGIINEYNLLTNSGAEWIVAVAGYILKQCVTIHPDCAKFRDFVTYVKQDVVDISETIIPYVHKGHCIMPQESFIEYIEMLELMFLNIIQESPVLSYDFKVARTIINQINVSYKAPCSCFPYYFPKKIFVTTRLNKYCQEMNNKRNIS